MTIFGQTVYTFVYGATSSTFVRDTGGGEFDRWFVEDTAHSEIKILRGTTRRTVIDVAGLDYAALTLRAEFTAEANATTMRGLRGRQGTLSNTRGESATVLLTTVRRAEVDSTRYGRVLDLTFKRLS